MKLTKQDREELRAFLNEYIAIFNNNKEHKRAHKVEPCAKCQLAKNLLRKLKNEQQSKI